MAKKINANRKGKAFERKVAHILSDNGFPARRGQQVAGSPDSPDVVSSDFPFHIECKAVEKLNLDNAMLQSIKDAGEKAPCVIHKKNHADILFTCKLDDFIKLLNEMSWKE